MTHKRKGRSVDLITDNRSGHSESVGHDPRTADPLRPHGHDAHERNVYDPDPYVLPPPSARESQGSAPHVNEGQDDASDSTPRSPRHGRGMSMGTTTTGGMSKAQMAVPGSARSHGTQRFVLHTDAGELDDDEVVELPPMYTQVQTRRGAAPTAPASSVGGATIGSHENDPLRP
ncbi:hypothetical protein FRC07_000377 [Ceratobasidium sp. 392]|nr:hypothetical protein FRC07_000377 [Ceratobasidium sp. 392]